MRTVANILWLILNGVWMAIAWAALCLTIIGIPFGKEIVSAAGRLGRGPRRSARRSVAPPRGLYG